MERRIFILIATLFVTAFSLYLNSVPLRRPSVPFRFSPIVQEPDAFDAPLVSDPALVKEFAEQKLEFPFKSNDRVAWMGSSSTYIGAWSKTLEFLLRTRHPDLKLSFTRHSTGGGTFETGVTRLPDWLARARPTLVFLNYGANDAALGQRGIEEFRANMQRNVEIVRESGARLILMSHQSGDPRETGKIFYQRRKHYAIDMLKLSKSAGWTIVDLYHPLDELQTKAQTQDDTFTINYDSIHLTDSGYAAWAFFLYDRLNPPQAESTLELDALSGKVVAAKNCSARVISSSRDTLAFERTDDVLPILPPSPLPSSRISRGRVSMASSPEHALDYVALSGQNLPPREFVPMEKHSKYMLKVRGLSEGKYLLECNGMSAGSANAAQLAAGVNLVSLVLDARTEPFWDALGENIWEGTNLSELSERTLRFKLTPAPK